MPLFNLNLDKVEAADEFRDAKGDLKPTGVYEVTFVTARTSFREGKAPEVSLELRIEGFFGKEGKELVTKQATGMPAFKNARVFFQGFITEDAILMFKDFVHAFTGEAVAAKDIAAQFNTFETEADIIAWVNSVVTTEVKRVWVSQIIPDVAGKALGHKPQNKVRFIQG
jgi:hypothetical protein